MVDCSSFLKYAGVSLPLEHQVEASTLVILNKTDLCSQEQVRAVRGEILEINPDVFIAEAVHADAPADFLREKLYNSGYDKKSSNTPDNHPEDPLTEDSENRFDPARVEVFCRSIMYDIIQIRGFFASPKEAR